MEDQLIEFETAKLAKEKGFNMEWIDKYVYDDKGTLHPYGSLVNR